MDWSNSKNSDGETSIGNTNMDVSPESNTDVTSRQGTDAELRFTGEPTGSNGDCSTSGSHQPESSRVLRNRSHGTGERNKRKRWRGRHDNFCYNPEISLSERDKQELISSTPIPSSKMSKEQQVIDWKVFLLNVKNRLSTKLFCRAQKNISSPMLTIRRINMRLHWG